MENIYELFSPPLKESMHRDIDLDTHRSFLREKESPKGGFYGRGEFEDVYYTFFGLLCQRILGMEHSSAEKTASYLGRFNFPDIPHLYTQIASLNILQAENPHIFSRAKEQILSLKAEGGFCRIANEKPSIYDTFLAMLSLNELEYEFKSEEQDEIIDFVLQHQTPDGGFSSLIESKIGTTNQAAAAIAILFNLDELDRLDRDTVCGFYRNLKHRDGGYYAGPNIPAPDLLSTYTSCLALSVLTRADEIDKEKIIDFVLPLQNPDGGFIGSFFDIIPDTEYTYYGLGLISLILEVLKEDR